MRRVLAHLCLLVSLACGGGGSSPTEPAPPPSMPPPTPTTSDLIDALFFGRGPLSQGENTNLFAAFRRGTGIRILVSTTLPAEGRQAARDFAAALPGLTNGSLSAMVVETADANPRPGEGEVSVRGLDSVAGICDAQFSGGCSDPTFFSDGTIAFGRVHMRLSNLAPGNLEHNVFHELGHCVLGLRHLLVTGAMMHTDTNASRTFSSDERDALTRVWSSTANPGDSRSVFVTLGLIGSTASHPPVGGDRPSGPSGVGDEFGDSQGYLDRPKHEHVVR